ncbi:tyrosine-type recombinase/integrase [Aerococcus urinaeequi]|uniref:tyrosine-type recombinase/integrase n=1 Tax=Aerococcus urinaeequi TaxID=51665 RepID=UPI003D6B36A5
MWSEELPSGKVRFAERYKDPLTDKWKIVRVTMEKETATTRKQAAKVLEQRIADKLNEKNGKPIEVKYLVEQYLKSYKGTVKEATYYKTDKRLKYLTNDIQNIKTDKLTAKLFNDLFLERLDTGLTYDTVRMDKSLLERLLRFGLHNDYVTDWTIVERLFVPKKNVSAQDEFKFLEKEELNEVIHQLTVNNKLEMARLVKIQVNTGLRFGELVSIDYRNAIDFEARTVQIERIFDQENKIYTLPKTNERRTIYLNDIALETIKEQIMMDKMRVLQYGLDRENVALFRSDNGLPRRPKFLNTELHKIKIPNKHLTSHIFRHTYVSLAVEQGIDKDTIAKQVGHANTKMIDNIYLHVTDKMEQDIADKLHSFQI